MIDLSCLAFGWLDASGWFILSEGYRMISDNPQVMGLYIIQKLRQSLPVDDLMEWLIKEHPQAELQQVLAMLNVIYQEEEFKITPCGGRKSVYQIGDKELSAYPQKVEAKLL